MQAKGETSSTFYIIDLLPEIERLISGNYSREHVELINEFEDKTIIIIITIIFFLQISWWRELMSFYWELDGNIIQGAFFLDVTHNAMISQFPQTIHETKETLSGGITKSVG